MGSRPGAPASNVGAPARAASWPLMAAGERTGEAARLSRRGWWRGRALSFGFLREKDVGIRSDVKLVETGNSLCGEEEGLAGDRLYLHLWK